MAFLEYRNVRIAGFSASVPKNTVNNLEATNISKDYDASAYVETTGVKERRIGNLTAGDLCYKAAEQLIEDLGWEKKEVGAIIFVSQHSDYIVPATSCILQDRLGLSKQCYSLDINLGCSGWVYGLSVAISLVSSGNIEKVLLCCGDAKRRSVFDDPLFGHAGAVTAIEFKEKEKPLFFDFGTDGSGYDSIIIPDGGARNPFSSNSYDLEEIDGKRMHRLQTRMKGMDVFSFGISTAPRSIRNLAERYGFNYQDYDFFVFHQANMKMNNMIAKKLKLGKEKVPSCMYHFGNTSSASIPLTIVTQLRNKCGQSPMKFICCGFGVGLSWGTVAFETSNIVISNLVEVSEEGIDQKYVI